MHGRRSRSKHDCYDIAENDGTLRCSVPHRFRCRSHPIEDSNDSYVLVARSSTDEVRIEPQQPC